jgi:hypothetical protein
MSAARLTKRDAADDTIADAVAESLDKGDTVCLPWSRELVAAIEALPDLDAWIPDGACDGYACGLDRGGLVWGIRLYNAADGGDR